MDCWHYEAICKNAAVDTEIVEQLRKIIRTNTVQIDASGVNSILGLNTPLTGARGQFTNATMLAGHKSMAAHDWMEQYFNLMGDHVHVDEIHLEPISRKEIFEDYQMTMINIYKDDEFFFISEVLQTLVGSFCPREDSRMQTGIKT